MVENTVVAVTSLKRSVIRAVWIFIEINAKLNDMFKVTGSFTYESVNCVNVIFKASGNESIILMILDIVGRGVVYSGDTALCKG